MHRVDESPNAWIHFLDAIPATVREAVLAILHQSGLRTSPMPADAQGYGLVVLGAVDDRVLEQIRLACRRAVVLVLVVAPCRLSAAEAWSLLRAGAADVMRWAPLPADAAQVGARLSRLRTVQALVDSPRVRDVLVGDSPAWRALVRQVVELAVFSRGPVLITGESGTGKELIARLIHDLDRRADKGSMVIVDCTTITPELSGSEFFGHERGAFTGAMNPREGAFALAHRGTLFLDEIGELPPPLQAQLLRVVQEGKYKRVGSNAWQQTEFRLVSATHRDLDAGVADGSFRADLYYRIAGSICRTPRLAERKEDVLELAAHFQAGFDDGDGGEGFDEPVRQYLKARDYPGNVRELRRVVSWLCHRHAGGGPVTIGDVPEDERPAGTESSRDALQLCFERAARDAIDLGLGLKEIGQTATDCAIRLAIEREQGNLHRAALRLGVTDRALQLRRAQQRPLH
ncbi:sigma-54-dependent transcriptional regulator [Variovorax saccharolyticus]|uniref:sigma-54-dependent transcriptional regulator n=1 Tax=Variovorax saccharolyticus TaxID=3053516 RepID=UPI002577E374|nr:sigma 54-interacting transcriptional regulator [Variovorax sp. J31P216]MDM0026599.1 sigma 54-interacting transcriptional regulator [Variovorax sp. J31P216]